MNLLPVSTSTIRVANGRDLGLWKMTPRYLIIRNVWSVLRMCVWWKCSCDDIHKIHKCSILIAMYLKVICRFHVIDLHHFYHVLFELVVRYSAKYDIELWKMRGARACGNILMRMVSLRALLLSSKLRWYRKYFS